MTTQAQTMEPKVMQGKNGPVLDANGNPVTEAPKQVSTTQQVAPPAPPAPEPKPEPKELGEDEEPKAGEKITLTAEAFKQRLQRATRSQMRSEFGTDDPKALKEKLSRLEALEREDDARKKAAMTEMERYKAERDEALSRATAAELRAQEIADERAYQETLQDLKTVATDYIKPKFWKAAQMELAEHLADSYTEEQLEKMDEPTREKTVRGWFENYVKENPELAKGEPATTQAPKQEPKTELKTAPLVTSKAGNKRSPPVITTGPYAGKTVAPGHPNSLTPAEYRVWKDQNGIQY